MSKAIFGAAITGILGASVAIYKNFGGSNYPLEGLWEFRLQRQIDGNIQCTWYGEIMIVNSVSKNVYIGLAGDAEDNNDSPACPYGVKALKSIEWNDKMRSFSFLIQKFPSNGKRLIDHPVPDTPLHFTLKDSGGDWASVNPDPNSSVSDFNMILHRE